MRKFKKIAAALVSFSMLLPIIPSALASEGITLSDVTYTLKTNDGEQPISAPQAGTVTTYIDVTNPGESDSKASLVVSATDNATGKLATVKSAAANVKAGQSKTMKVAIDLDANQTLNYYVWDGVQTHAPLRNTRPTDITNLSCKPKTNQIDLSWDPSLDNKGIDYYLVKLDGKEIAKSKAPSCSIMGLDTNSTHNCEVTAYDEEGLCSAPYAVNDVKTYDIEELVLKDYTNANGTISFLENHTSDQMDSYTIPDYIAGRDCFRNQNSPKADGSGYKLGYFYFPVSPLYIDQTVRNVAVEVTYYDEGTDSLTIAYNAADGSPGKKTTFCSRTNTKTWRTSYIQLNDAKFTNPQTLTGSAFRIEGSPGTRIYKVAVVNGDMYAPNAPNVQFGNLTTDTYDMSFYPDNSMSAYGIDYSNIDGVDCMYAPNGGTFEFNISDVRATKTGGYIEVNYYDDGEDTLVAKYTNALNKDATVDFTNTGSFKTVQIPLYAAIFGNKIVGADNNKFDFTLSTKNGTPLAIKSVKYVPADSDYVAPEKTEEYAEVNAAGTDFDGDLVLKRWVDSYDRNIAFNAEGGMDPIDEKTYSYNVRFTDYPAGKGWQEWRNSWYFDVPDAFVYDTNYDKLEIVIDYYVPAASGNLVLMVNSDSSKYTYSPLASGQWSTATFTVDKNDGMNSQFSNGYSGADFKIMFESCQGYIHKVTVRKVKN